MEPYLANREKTKELLARHDFLIKKGYGQNFLIHPAVPEGIVEAAEVTREDTVLEIGPGIGTLTQYLAGAAGRVLAVEIDRKLEPVLAESLAGFGNTELIWGDILKLDIEEIFRERGIRGPVKVVANLPYYITTPILMRLLRQREWFASLTVMVQSEVGERMAASPGGKDYGYLSLSIQYYAEPRIVLQVPPHAFLPQPKVSSVVVQMKAKAAAEELCKDPDYMFIIAKAAFLQRRKTLANAISSCPQAGVGRLQVEQALRQMGKDERIRGEKLDLREFAELAGLLKEGIAKQEEMGL